MSDYSPLDFRLEQPQNQGSLVYRPWGTRTLKVKVSAGKPVPALRIRPQGMRPEEVKAGLVRGLADDCEAFILSWGGGHEQGPCVKAKDVAGAFERCISPEVDEASMLFFNLSHVGPDLPAQATLTLEAYDVDSGAVHSTLAVRLERPAELPASLLRVVPAGEDRWAASDGRFIGRYDARWWPAADVTYEAWDSVPLSVRRKENQLLVYWGQGESPIATIEDSTRPSVLDRDAVSFELFSFADDHIVLRVWFFWLDKKIGHGFFVGRHEVPDVERFDLVIRPRDGRVILACTDSHWRELWGEVPDSPWPAVEATLGISLKVVGALLKDHGGESQVPEDQVINPLSYIERLAQGSRAMPSFAPGTEAHIPMLHNITRRDPMRMTSSDVRLG